MDLFNQVLIVVTLLLLLAMGMCSSSWLNELEKRVDALEAKAVTKP